MIINDYQKRRRISLRIFFVLLLVLFVIFTAHGLRADISGDAADMYAIHLVGEEMMNGGQDNYGAAINLYSKNMLLIRLEDFQTVGELHSDVQIYPASMTKMMTALLAIEAIDNLDTKITLGENLLDSLKEKNASVAGFLPGEEVSVRDLLYGTLLPSGADAAVALACYISGSEDEFAKRMNDKAKSLGMFHTHFANATGLHDDSHVTTLKDMALLMEYALDNPVFLRIFTTRDYQTEPTNLHENGIYLKSTLFDKMADASEVSDVDADGAVSNQMVILGGKTGYTGEAGLCLASLAQIGNKEYILLTAGACGDTTTQPYHILDAVQVYEHIK